VERSARGRRAGVRSSSRRRDAAGLTQWKPCRESLALRTLVSAPLSPQNVLRIWNRLSSTQAVHSSCSFSRVVGAA
jgi:hypothetical protein